MLIDMYKINMGLAARVARHSRSQTQTLAQRKLWLPAADGLHIFYRRWCELTIRSGRGPPVSSAHSNIVGQTRHTHTPAHTSSIHRHTPITHSSTRHAPVRCNQQQRPHRLSRYHNDLVPSKYDPIVCYRRASCRTTAHARYEMATISYNTGSK